MVSKVPLYILNQIKYQYRRIKDKPSWLVGLRARIEKLVSRYGYEAAKSHIQKTVEDTEKKESVLLDVKVERNGESAIMYEYNRQKKPLRSFDEDDISKTTEDPANNTWVKHVENFIIAVISTYSKDQVEPQLKPAINAIEKDKSITISDIDVNLNDDGNVDVEIKQLESKSRKPARKPHSSNTGSHKLRDYTIMSE
ncbi:uncharacterized protein [Choristoneura fumiferana]|uniref:uncharacterized protein n=1 Tax=Choristoneura fumiferana TaxID=7141 RepID=UPI003D15B6D5